jgi:hypothetical protein
VRTFSFLKRRPEKVAADVDAEIALHFEMRVDELQAQGLALEAARRQARHEFGDVEATRQYCRQQDEQKETRMQRTLMLQDIMQDFKICCRSLLRSPVLAATIVLTVGLGIGATAAIFSAVNAALLRPLPYRQPEQLVRVYTDTPPFRFRFSIADYLAFREQQTSFEQTATYTDRAVTYSDGSAAELLRGRVVSSGYFGVLGITPAFGRDLAASDERPGAPPVVIASYGFWEQRLGARPAAIGSMVRLDGAEHMVIGVLPRQLGPLEQNQDFFIAQQFAPPPRR